MTISPIQYPIYQQPNYFQPFIQPCIYQPQIVAPLPQFNPPVQPIYPQYNIYSQNNYEQDNYYPHPFYSPSADSDAKKNLLYAQNNIQGLLDFAANKPMKDMYPQVKDNADFKELLTSKYYQNGVGFINLLDTISYLKYTREKELQPKQPIPGCHVDDFFKNLRTDYSKYDTADYLRILNNFVKSDKISDDLKRYYIAKESKNLSAYYDRMDKISESNDIVNTIL